MNKVSMRNTAVLGGVALVVVGVSYLEERPKYAFEAEVRAGLQTSPWSRAVGTMTSADLTSPVSWISPAKTTWRIAQPAMGDGSRRLRFQESVVAYPGDASIYLLDVDCQAKKIDAADVDQPSTAEPMVNMLGEPVRDGQDRAFRYIVTSQPFPTDDLPQFCETGWSKERQALPN